MAKALADQKSLIIWEIFNHPYGLIPARTQNSGDPCFKTNSIKYHYPNWSKATFNIADILRFINKHASTLHLAAPSKLVAITDLHFEQLMVFNIFSDECLIKAGGRENGYLDIYQFSNRVGADVKDLEDLLLRITSADLNFNKPLIISELSFESSQTHNTPEKFLKAFNSGYSGCLAYAYDNGITRESINKEIKSISHHLGKIDLSED